MELTFTIGLAASLVTILGASASGVRYLGRGRTVELVADRLGVDLYELSGGLDAALRRSDTAALAAALERLAHGDSDVLEPEDFAVIAGANNPDKRLVREALRSGSNLELTNIVAEALAAEEGGSVQLIGDAIVHADREKLALLGEHLTDSDIEVMAEVRNVWPNPIERVIRVDDDPSCAYAWLLSDEATEEDRHSLKAEVEEMYIKYNSKEPESLHFVVNNVDDIRELDSETVETYVKPWLNDMDNTEDNR